MFLCGVNFFGLLFGALGCLVKDGVFHKVEKDARSMHQTLPIDDYNRVNDSITTLIVVAEGQDIPSEVMFPNALIDLSRIMVEGEDLQSVEVDRSIVNVVIKPLTMVVESQVVK